MRSEGAAEESAPFARTAEVVSARIRELARAREVSIGEVIAACGYSETSRSGYYRLLAGDADFPLTMLLRIARTLRCASIEELLGETGSGVLMREIE